MDLVSGFKLTATPLHGRLREARDAEPFVARLTTDPDALDRGHQALLVSANAGQMPPGFAAYIHEHGTNPLLGGNRALELPGELSYLDEGDVIRVNPRSAEVWVMYRRNSKANSLLLTERCNSFCVMCSQPPTARDDETLVRAWLDAIPLMSPETAELGFTGGEPTLLGDLFLELVVACKEHLPTTALHILSNGRMFNYLSFTQQLAAMDHPDLMVGIPIYSDLAWQHEFVVQAPGSFDQTIRGILNLARCRVPVEVRVVLHRHTVNRLPRLAEYLCRNLPFVSHVALMGLEPIGFAKSNLGALWVDPIDYQHELGSAVQTLACHGMNVSIYNHQLCVLPEALWPFARQSISDWKSIYLPACRDCTVRDRCGGFFHSATDAHSRAIRPVSGSVELHTQPLT